MKTEFDSLALKHQTEIYPARYEGKVPKKVKLLRTVTSDPFPFGIKQQLFVCEIDYIYPVWVNSNGAVAAILAQGDLLGLKPDEFEVVEWHEVKV